MAYIVAEAVIIYNCQNRNAALARMDSRLDLLLHCISTDDHLVASVVKYLAKHMMNDSEYVNFNTVLSFLLSKNFLNTFIFYF